ncbi:MAG: oligosaccharide flippase family protein [Polyangiaceae bacterium]|jgi:O-antigen/teichoic acid export membrane protein
MARDRGLRDVLRSLSLKALSLGLERVCRLVVVVALAPILGQAAFGRFVFASTVTALLALGTDLGLGVWTTRALARSRAQSDRPAGEGWKIVEVGLAIRSLAALPYTCAVVAVALFAAHGEARTAMGLLGVGALVNAFVDHFGAILRGYERFADEARLNAVRALLIAVAGLATSVVARSLIGLCAGLTAANLGGFAYGVVMVERLRANEVVRIVRPVLDRAWAKTALHQSLPLWFAGLFSMLYFKVDTLFLRSMSGDAELGVYGAAFKLFEGVMVLPAVLLSVLFPRLARVHDDPPAQRRLERLLGAVLLASGALVAATCLAFGAPLIRVVFGPGFGRAVPLLRILAVGVPLLFLNYGLTHFLVARDRGMMTQWFAFGMLGLNVVLDIVLIPRAGGAGAAWATDITEFVLTACCLCGLRLAMASTRTLPSAPREASTGRRAA